jgi:hypothetical protein
MWVAAGVATRHIEFLGETDWPPAMMLPPKAQVPLGFVEGVEHWGWVGFVREQKKSPTRIGGV